MYPSCKICQGNCICKNDYIGDTERISITRWNDHNDPTHDYEAEQHLYNNLNHSFNWLIVASASSNKGIYTLKSNIHCLKKNENKCPSWA